MGNPLVFQFLIHAEQRIKALNFGMQIAELKIKKQKLKGFFIVLLV